MARFLPSLFNAGVRAIIGKGELHGEDVAPFLSHGAVYLGAIGGLGALLAKQISSTRIVAYDDLGPEALHSLQIFAFPYSFRTRVLVDSAILYEITNN